MTTHLFFQALDSLFVCSFSCHLSFLQLALRFLSSLAFQFHLLPMSACQFNQSVFQNNISKTLGIRCKMTSDEKVKVLKCVLMH